MNHPTAKTVPDEEGPVKSKATKKSSNKDHLFPGKLYKLLDNPHHEDIIRWMDHGRSWKIVDRKMLGEALKKYWKHENVESFIRSANWWGFERIKSDDSDKNSYYHPYFLRGLRILYQQMKKDDHALFLPNQPNLSELAKSKPLPLDGVERSLEEALDYVHHAPAPSRSPTPDLPPPPPAPSPTPDLAITANNVAQGQPPKSTDTNGATMPSHDVEDAAAPSATAASYVTPPNDIVHGQPPSMSSYAIQGASPSFMMHPTQPLLTCASCGATMPSYAVQHAVPSSMFHRNNVDGQPLLPANMHGSVVSRCAIPTAEPPSTAANFAMPYHVQEQPLPSSNLHGATMPYYATPMTCTPSVAVQNMVATMPSNHMQEPSQTMWETQFHLLNTTMISGVDPRVPSHYHPHKKPKAHYHSHKEPTATLLPAGHQGNDEPCHFNQTMPTTRIEPVKGQLHNVGADNHATETSDLSDITFGYSPDEHSAVLDGQPTGDTSGSEDISPITTP